MKKYRKARHDPYILLALWDRSRSRFHAFKGLPSVQDYSYRVGCIALRCELDLREGARLGKYPDPFVTIKNDR